jgi:hypothetical protein
MSGGVFQQKFKKLFSLRPPLKRSRGPSARSHNKMRNRVKVNFQRTTASRRGALCTREIAQPGTFVLLFFVCLPSSAESSRAGKVTQTCELRILARNVSSIFIAFPTKTFPSSSLNFINFTCSYAKKGAGNRAGRLFCLLFQSRPAI